MAEDARNKRSRNKLLLIGGLAFVIVATVAALMLLADPFGWNLLDKASGLRDEAAGAMPPNAGLYAGIDLINFSEEKLTEFSQPFVAALAEPGVQDLSGGLDRLDATLTEEIGLTLRDDVMPWLGRSVGLAITELTLRPDGSVDHLSWLLVAGTQDRQAADVFLARLSQQLSQRSGVEAMQSQYRGRSITHFSLDEATPYDGLALLRSAGLVIIGSGETPVREAIDAQEGQSLADDEVFQRLAASLPEERGLTLYIDQNQLPQLNHLLAATVPLAIGPLDVSSLTLPTVAVGASIVEQGLRLDTAVQADENSNGQSGAREMVGHLPPSTLAFLNGGSLEEVWQGLKGSLAAGGNLSDFEESMALMSREFGYNPDQALLPMLDGEWVLALLPAQEGLLRELTGQPLGLVLLASSKDPDALAQTVDDLSHSLADQRLPMATNEIAGNKATTVDLASLIGTPLPWYGVDENILFLGTDENILARVLTGVASTDEGSLSSVQGYQSAAAMLPEGYRISGFVDSAGVIAQSGGTDRGRSGRLLEPVRQVVVAGGPMANGVRPGLAFVIVE